MLLGHTEKLPVPPHRHFSVWPQREAFCVHAMTVTQAVGFYVTMSTSVHTHTRVTQRLRVQTQWGHLCALVTEVTMEMGCTVLTPTNATRIHTTVTVKASV